MILKEIDEARKAAEQKLGTDIPDEIAKSVLEYTVRKCRISKQPLGYVPILYRTELLDYFMRLSINMMGGTGDVQCLSPITM